MTQTFDTSINFWEANMHLKLIEPFKSFRYEDKTRDKEHSSKIMWAIALIYNMKSTFYNLPEEGDNGKIAIISKDFIGVKDYFEKHSKTMTPIIEMYKKLSDTVAQRALRAWDDKMEERTQFIKVTPYKLDHWLNEEKDDSGIETWVKYTGTVDIIDRMMSNTKKLFDDYLRILESLSQEEGKGGAEGGGNLSATDLGLI